MSLISTVEELRLYSPANAIDHIDSIAGFLDSSEHDFLQEKLGQELYASLTDYYRNLRNSEGGVMTFVNSVTNGEEMLPYAQLLSVCQRVICYDALARAIDQQAISVNGAGVNIAVSDDYGKADQDSIRAYKASCNKEAHAAVNRLLYLLESWVKASNAIASTTVPSGSPEGSEGGVSTPSPSDEFTEIAKLWRSSRFYFLAAGLIIPSANVLQEYLNIYDSREKFITMLPDLRTIQEDILAPIFGEDFLDEIVVIATAGTADKFLSRIIHKLRKVAARHLEARTMAIKVGDPRRETAHNEAVALVSDLASYLSLHQADILSMATDATVPDGSPSDSEEGGVPTPSSLAKAFTLSPLYKAPDPLPQGEDSDYEEQWENNRPGNAMFVTPSLS